MAEYPAHLECDVVLADGGTVHVRPIRPEDGDALVDLRTRVSDESLYLRFHSAPPKFTPERLAHLTQIDYEDRMALLVLLGRQVVAVARYERTPASDHAEVAFLVDDADQGRGIGTLLLEHLAAAARDHGIRRFTADVLAGNRRMLRVFKDAGWDVETERDAGVVTLVFPIEETDRSREASSEREHRAEAASIRRLLHPRSIAVIGASRTPGTIGHELFLNLLRGDFNGPVYPVNPSSDHVAGVAALGSVLDTPEPVDLAVVVVPAGAVEGVVEECAKKGTTGLVIISAGFSESGGEAGEDTERRVVELARAYGMRLVGPNCMGVANTHPDVRMNATFAPYAPVPGPVAFMSQSGAFGIALLEWTTRLDLGVSTFVSAGNKADVSGNDLLQYWEDDEATKVVLLYLESFGNPRKFARLARRVSHTKPIVAVKGGRTAAGTRAAASHTAAAASPDIAVDALFHQTGVIRVGTVAEMFGVAQLLAFQPLPWGRGVAIISNGGGPGILAADACEQAGLEVPELSPETQARLREFLPPEAAVSNPVDLVASATAEAFERSVGIVLADPAVDALVVQFTPPLVTSSEDVAAAVARAAATSGGKPVASVFLATAGIPKAARGQGSALPVYDWPEEAVLALSRAVTYAEWCARPEGTVPTLEVDDGTARSVVDEFLLRHPEGEWADSHTATQLLAAYRIPTVPTEWVPDAEAAAAVAERLGFPVAVKAGDPRLVHKTEAGGVHLGLETADEVRAAVAALPPTGGAVVQPMVAGVETIVGVIQDPSFGPLVMFGLGGVTTELLSDRAFRILPLTDADAGELVRSLRGSPLLFGYRGAPESDTAALEQLLLRVGQMAEDLPELAEMDLNPVMVSPEGAFAVDVKVRLASAPPPEPTVRRLRAV